MLTHAGVVKTIMIVPAGRQPKPTIRVILEWTAMIARR